MRLVSAFLFVVLTAPLAVANEAKPADPKPESAIVSRHRVPLRVVRMLPETRQVLLYDKNRGTHVVAEVGQDIGGYVVDDIAEDEVTLVAGNGTEVILTGPDPTWRPQAASPKVPAAPATPAPGDAPAMVPVDPYAELDLAPGIAAFVDAVSTEPAKPAATPAAGDAKADAGTALASAATGSPAPAAPTVLVPVRPAAPAGVIVSRSEIATALADFGATAVTFDAVFVAEGLRFDQIATGTILAKLGLATGDVLTAVDHQPLHSLDDAASLYARAGTARSATLDVLRGGKPTTLKVTIR